MKKITYHKLIRDKIPAIIEAQGNSCVTQVLSEDDYLKMLDEKLSEELAEYQESKSIEELADLLEVMRSVVAARGYTWEALEAVRQQKFQKRGGFAERLLLKEVIEK